MSGDEGGPAGAARDEVRLRIVDAQLLALERWDEVGALVSTSVAVEEALERVGTLLGIGQPEVFHVLDLPLVSRVPNRIAALLAEREELRRGLGSAPDQRQS